MRMKNMRVVLCLTFTLIGGMIRAAYATPQYSASVMRFENESALFSGSSTHLFVVFEAEPDEIEQSFLSSEMNAIVPFHFPDIADHMQVMAKENLHIAVIANTSLDALTTEDLATSQFVEPVTFNLGDLVVFETASAEFWTMEITRIDVPVTANSGEAAPEPSTLVLLGLGLIGVFALLIRRKRM